MDSMMTELACYGDPLTIQYITAKQAELHSTWELFGKGKWLWAEWMLPNQCMESPEGHNTRQRLCWRAF